MSHTPTPEKSFERFMQDEQLRTLFQLFIAMHPAVDKHLENLVRLIGCAYHAGRVDGIAELENWHQNG